MVGPLLVDNTGESIPPDTPYAVSVSLPTWKANVGYEEGEDWVLSKMRTGYPRFYIHDCIRRLSDLVLQDYGREHEQALLFPSHRVACRCIEFLKAQQPSLQDSQTRVLDIKITAEQDGKALSSLSGLQFSVALFPGHLSVTAKAFWQHTGEGISSRQADYIRQHFHTHIVMNSSLLQQAQRSSKGPKRYQRGEPTDKTSLKAPSKSKETNASKTSSNHNEAEGQECVLHVEERYGRNLDLSLAPEAKIAVKRRIAGLLTANVELRKAIGIPGNPLTTRLPKGFSEEDVYLFPTGMSSIFSTHQVLLTARGPLKSICYGFPYIDTLKILQKWGPGCLFYGHGSAEELDDLQRRLEEGERFLALFCEFPSNPLLRSPDLKRIKALADSYGFPVVVDETVGNFLNVHVLPYADLVVSSLTKIFSGDSNVMGGSAVLNPHSKYYTALKDALATQFEDNYWAEDAIVMERNSRDFASRIQRINSNAEAICEVLKAHARVKEVYYPKHSPTRPFYDQCRNQDGGYGGLLSVTFTSAAEAVTFFDRLEIAKGPSLGTNFTLSCPYTLLAHYGELDWAASFGVEADLVRISVGLEDTGVLTTMIQRALAAVSAL